MKIQLTKSNKNDKIFVVQELNHDKKHKRRIFKVTSTDDFRSFIISEKVLNAEYTEWNGTKEITLDNRIEDNKPTNQLNNMTIEENDADWKKRLEAINQVNDNLIKSIERASEKEVNHLKKGIVSLRDYVDFLEKEINILVQEIDYLKEQI